jgi:small multidrug resistance pump
MILTETSWLCLSVAILFGVMGTVCLKLSNGMQKVKPSICLMIFYLISFASLTLAVQGVDVSIVYAIWSGIGTILVAIIGVLVFHEYVSFIKVISLLCIVLGVAGINLANVIH